MNNDQLLNQLTLQAVDSRRLMLGRFIFNRLGGTIAYGPLRGFRLNEQQAWGQGDLTLSYWVFMNRKCWREFRRSRKPGIA